MRLLRRLPAVDEFGASLVIGMLHFKSLAFGIRCRPFLCREAHWPHVANRKPLRVQRNPAAAGPCQMIVFDCDDNLQTEDVFPNLDPKGCQSLFAGNRRHGQTLFFKTVDPQLAKVIAPR